MYKKGQSISINTIIIAAIGLAVLIVLFYIFTARSGLFIKGIEDTDTCSQKCASLDMNAGTAPSEDSKTCFDGQYISGSYKDGKFGCCCIQKT